jgi:hypothetical protein
MIKPFGKQAKDKKTDFDFLRLRSGIAQSPVFLSYGL